PVIQLQSLLLCAGGIGVFLLLEVEVPKIGVGAVTRVEGKRFAVHLLGVGIVLLSHVAVDRAQIEIEGSIVGSELDGVLVLCNGFVVALVVIEENRQLVVAAPRIWAQSDGLAEGGLGIGGASRAFIRLGQADLRVGTVRVKLKRALILLKGEIVLSGAAVDVAERDIDGGQAVIQLNGLVAV